jgi:hypothetical protein
MARQFRWTEDASVAELTVEVRELCRLSSIYRPSSRVGFAARGVRVNCVTVTTAGVARVDSGRRCTRTHR